MEQLLPKARAAADPQVLAPSLVVAALVAARHDGVGVSDFVRELIELTRSRADRYRALFLLELTRLCTAASALDLARDLVAGLSVDLGR